MNAKIFVAVLILWACIRPWAGAAAADPAEISGKLLFLAAASTTEAVDEIRAEFVRLHTGVTIRASYGASSALARQITAGAEADIFLSASTEWAEYLNKDKLVDRQRDLLSNELVIITPVDSELRISHPRDLLVDGVRHLALADFRSVPAGVYARQALTALDLWPRLEPRVAGAADVRQALHFVETGAAEAGIVYATDARASKRVRVAARIDPKLSDPIRYPVVLLKHGAGNAAAVAFYDFLLSPAAAAIFRRQGFIVLDGAAAAQP